MEVINLAAQTVSTLPGNWDCILHSPHLSSPYMPETIQYHATYDGASIAACAWVEQGKKKVDPASVRLCYR